MIDCEMLVDKMPLVLHGQAAWTPEEAAHLLDCAECASTWRLVGAAPRIGTVAAAAVDIPRLTRQLHERLARERRARRRNRTGWLTGLAAAAVLSLMVWRGGRQEPVAMPTVATAAGAGFEVPLAELEALDGDQLQAVLEALDAPLGSADGGPTASFGDLDDSQLERVLRSLEG